MGTEEADISGIPFTSSPPFSHGDKWWNELSSTPEPTPSQPVLSYPDHSRFRGLLAAESSTVHSDPCTHPFRRGGNTIHMIPIDYASCQGIRGSSVLLDTRKWSPSRSFANPRTTLQSQFPLIDMGSDASQALSVSDGGANRSYAATSGSHIAPDPQAILHSQRIPDLISGSFGSMRCHYTNPVTDLDNPTFPTGNTPTSSSPLGSTEEVTNFVNDETQPPVMIYRPPGKQHSDRRRSKRGCAINVGGLWIDKDDLYSGAGRGSGMISVHECQWARSSDPCGMWIVGSRSQVGAHIRKWHTKQRDAKGTAECLWDGCAKAMLKDSISRHVVTVHLDEAFHCRGCDQVFPRKDVYNQHVEDSAACRGAGATMVYGAESRVIDTRHALDRGGGAVRYAGR